MLGKYTEVLFIDFRSAFDTIDHHKLEQLILNDTRLPGWFKAFVYKVFGNCYITPSIEDEKFARQFAVKVNRGVP